MTAQVVGVRDVPGVRPDLLAGREEPAPGGVGLEGVGVDGGRDVDRQPRVPIDVPGAAHVGLPVEDEQVVDPEPLELDGGTHAAEPGADDDGLVVGLVVRHGVPSVRRAARSCGDEQAE